MPKVSRGAAAAEVVSSAEVKEWLRVDSGDTSQDDVITDLITAGRQAVEGVANIALTNTTVTWTVDADDLRAPIWLPVWPASSVTSITTYNGKAGDDDTTVNAANYELVGNKVVQRASGFSAAQTDGAGQIVFVAGFGANATDVPLDLKKAVLLWIADRYENRETVVVGTVVGKLPENVMTILRDGGYLWGWH